MKERIELASRIALAAGALQMARFSEPRQIETKSSAIDLVTDVDRACEELILERLRKERPDDAVLTEETGAHPGSSGDSEIRWVVDPLDGTVNYAHGIPHFAVSIGIERAGECQGGVVYDPFKGELFEAVRGEGARLNGSAIAVSRTESLGRSLLCTGFAYDVHSAEDDNLDHFVGFMKRARAVRRIGSAALDLAYVACGRFDGFWELALHPWDVSAGFLLVTEAGGRITDLGGGAPTPERCVASNGRIHAEMLAVLARRDRSPR